VSAGSFVSSTAGIVKSVTVSFLAPFSFLGVISTVAILV